MPPSFSLLRVSYTRDGSLTLDLDAIRVAGLSRLKVAAAVRLVAFAALDGDLGLVRAIQGMQVELALVAVVDRVGQLVSRAVIGVVVVTTPEQLGASMTDGADDEADGADVGQAIATDGTVLRTGTLSIASTGEGALVLRRVPGVERVQTLLHHMIEEDADRRAREGAGHLADGGGRGSAGWDSGWDSGWDTGPDRDRDTGWDTGGHRTATLLTDPLG